MTREQFILNFVPNTFSIADAMFVWDKLSEHFTGAKGSSFIGELKSEKVSPVLHQ